MADAIQVMITTDKEEIAQRIAEQLVERRLAACVQITAPVQSVYRWQGQVERASELLCFIKTTRERYAEVEAVIKQLHNYEEPEILAIPVVAGSSGYLAWLQQQVAP